MPISRNSDCEQALAFLDFFLQKIRVDRALVDIEERDVIVEDLVQEE